MMLSWLAQGTGSVPRWVLAALDHSHAVVQTGRLLQGFSPASQRQLTTAISEDVLDGE